MSFLPSDSAIKVDAALEDKLNGASFEEIKAYLANAAVEQRLVVPDVYDNSVLIPTALASAAPKRFAKAVTINGVKHIIEGDTEQALLQGETELYRAQLQPAARTERSAQPRGIGGRFVSQIEEDRADQKELLRQSDLELRWKRGEITSDVYLSESGALGRVLQAQGLPLEELKAAVEERRNQNFTQSWVDASEAFKSLHPEWIGGENNRDLLGGILVEKGLVDSEDKLAALEIAYDHAVKNDLLTANPETEYQRELQDARSAEEVNAVNHKYFGTGLFNRQ